MRSGTFPSKVACLPVLLGKAETPSFRTGPYPGPSQYPVIKRLGIKTVINLLDQFPDSYKVYLDALDVRYVHVPVKGNKQSPEDMSRTAANQVLKLLIEPTLQPVLLHCRSGKHRTGAIIGCLRRLQGLSAEAAADEYRQFATPKQREVDEIFIQRFDPGLCLA